MDKILPIPYLYYKLYLYLTGKGSAYNTISLYQDGYIY